MASSNSVKVYGHIVEWNLEDGSGVSEATSTLAWYSTEAPAAKHAGSSGISTKTWWMVKTITFLAGATQTSGSPNYVRLLEKDSSGAILFHATLEHNVFDVQTQTYNPPLRCRPVWFTSKSVGFATGAKFIFLLA